MNEQKHLVFVYGTFMTGERNHHFVADAELVWDDCWTYGELYDTGNGYPAMVRHPEHRVYGELYRVTADQLRQVDRLEGYAGPWQDNHYERINQAVFKGSSNFKVFVYVYTGEQVCRLERIVTGDWVKRRN